MTRTLDEVRLLRPAEAAAVLGVSVRQLDRLVEAGRLQAVRLTENGNRRFRVRFVPCRPHQWRGGTGMGTPSERDEVMTAFLRQADEPEGVSTIEAQRYWELAGNELRRIISSLGGTPLSATAAGEPALLCLGEQGAAIVTIRGNSFVVHRVRRGAGPISIRETGPMLAEFSERDCNIEIDVPGLPGPIVVSGLSQADLQGRRDAIFSALAD